MRYLSLFSGIEAATLAWQPLGWECVGVSEIESFPCAVLEHHYPHIPNLGDVTKITEQQIKDLGQIDLVVFGSPCQNLSVAGNRRGFDGDQSSLFYAAMEIIKHAKQHCGTRFALWENVPGAFSSNAGRDFASVVANMAGLENVTVPKNGWGKEGAALGDSGLLEWSVLDAQWFRLAQRRKRVFAIVDFGEWASRPPILLERQSLRGDTPPSRETRQDTTADVKGRLASGTELAGPKLANCGEYHVVGFREGGFGEFVSTDTSATIRAAGGSLGGGSESLVCCHGTQDPLTNSNFAYAIGCNSGQENVIAIQGNAIGRKPENGPQGSGYDEGVCFTLTSTDRHAVAYGCAPTTICPNKVNAITASYGLGGADLETKPLVMTLVDNTAYYFDSANYVVRRLTPIECERLQGFPDNFTQIPYCNKSADNCPNGVRYKALGNSMAVSVMAWIGRQIESIL